MARPRKNPDIEPEPRLRCYVIVAQAAADDGQEPPAVELFAAETPMGVADLRDSLLAEKYTIETIYKVSASKRVQFVNRPQLV